MWSLQCVDSEDQKSIFTKFINEIVILEIRSIFIIFGNWIGISKFVLHAAPSFIFCNGFDLAKICTDLAAAIKVIALYYGKCLDYTFNTIAIKFSV